VTVCGIELSFRHSPVVPTGTVTRAGEIVVMRLLPRGRAYER
jgi:hypothetical protein